MGNFGSVGFNWTTVLALEAKGQVVPEEKRSAGGVLPWLLVWALKAFCV